MPEPVAMTRAEAAAALGVTPKTISNLINRGRLRRLGWGRVDRASVESLVAARVEEREQREAKRNQEQGGPVAGLVRVDEAARILASSRAHRSTCGAWAASDRLPFVDAGPAGTGRRRLYRRSQLEVIASARGCPAKLDQLICRGGQRRRTSTSATKFKGRRDDPEVAPRLRLPTGHAGGMKLRNEARVLKQKAHGSMRTAMTAFNSPHDDGRVTAVLLQLQHSFEMLLKASLVQTKVAVFDVHTGRSIGFSRCLHEARSSAVLTLSEEEAGTLRAVDAMRDDEQHWFTTVDEGLLYLHTRAAVTLFDELLFRAFRERLADHLRN